MASIQQTSRRFWRHVGADGLPPVISKETNPVGSGRENNPRCGSHPDHVIFATDPRVDEFDVSVMHDSHHADLAFGDEGFHV